MNAKFNPGRIVITRNALNYLNPDDVRISIGRHLSGDWGNCGAEDWQSNEEALIDGLRLFSVYADRAGVKFWIITEADRSSTTVLLPEDY